MDQPHQPLIEEIDAFTQRVNMSPVTFGRKAMADPNFVRDLRNGRRLWPDTEAKARAYMAEYKPEAEESAKAA